MQRLPLSALRAFAAVYEAGGVRPAARALQVTHSSVSRHLHELEAWLGVALTPVTYWSLLLAVPYVSLRLATPSRSFPGPLRPLRILPWLARDTMFLVTLLAGSVRFRSLLL